LPADCDLTLETWLDNSNYPFWRKEELRIAALLPEDKECYKVKLHIKDEFYSEYKHARPINSRSDKFKTLIGPFSHAVEKVVFKLKWFIKTIPCDQRALFIKQMDMVGYKFFATDYSSFESLFTKQVMAIEQIMLNYMAKNLPNKKDIHRWISVIKRKQYIVNKNFSLTIEAKRMSGEMFTSLCNGWTNLILTMFVLAEIGIDADHVIGVFEGDDGLFGIPSNKDIDVSLYKKMGMEIKIQSFPELNHASFCGQIFDNQDVALITDPVELLGRLSWISGVYKNSKTIKKLSLLRCKALSYFYQYPNCPIITRIAEKLMYLTRSLNSSSLMSQK
jgi:hypothetical protein